MFDLSDEQQERAERLRRESFVFADIPRSEPAVMRPEKVRLTAEWLAKGEPSGAVLDRIVARRTQEMKHNPEEHERIAGHRRAAVVREVGDLAR